MHPKPDILMLYGHCAVGATEWITLCPLLAESSRRLTLGFNS